MSKWIVPAVFALLSSGVIAAQAPRPLSPGGSAAAQVLGNWSAGQNFTLGRGSYQGGKWIEITYGRPLKRGRDVFGSGAEYGKAALVGAPIWRAGADVTTQLTSEVPLMLAGKTVPAGRYSVFVDLKQGAWTLVLSSLPVQPKYDPAEKTAVWGAYNYTPDKDVVRVPMKLETLPHAREQLTWEFVDMTRTGGTLALAWDKTMATVPFTVAQ